MPLYNPVRSLQRGLAVLQALNRCNGARPQQIARMVGVPRPTVYRLLETLEGLDFVRRSPSDDTWHLSLLVRTLSDGFVDEVWIRQCAMPVMEALGRELLWPIDLHTALADRMVVRESTHRTSPFSIDHGMVGADLPMLLTSSGRAYLAFCPDDERAAILERLRRSTREDDALAADTARVEQLLAQTRAQGYGARTREYRSHTSSLSVPVHIEGRVPAVLTVIWIASALSFEDGVRQIVGPLQKAAAAIAERYRASGDSGAAATPSPSRPG